MYLHIQKSTLFSILQHPAFSIFGTMYVVFWLFELGKSLQRNSFMQIGEPTMLKMHSTLNSKKCAIQGNHHIAMFASESKINIFEIF